MDTQLNVPCSNPQLLWTSPTVGISAPPQFYLPLACRDTSYFTRRRNLLAINPQYIGLCGAGSCNTYSTFWNGGTGTGTGKNGISTDTYTAAILASQFLAANATAVPTPAPAPQPTLPPAPAPAPRPPVVCTSDTRTRAIKAVGCTGPSGLYIASAGTANGCDNDTVYLRTRDQVNKEPDRIRWTLENNGRIVSKARSISCPDSSNLAGKIGTDTIKVGGYGWRWRVEPLSSDSCDRVRLVSRNRKIRKTGKDVLKANAACNGFSWGTEGTEGTEGHWRLV